MNNIIRDKTAALEAEIAKNKRLGVCLIYMNK